MICRRHGQLIEDNIIYRKDHNGKRCRLCKREKEKKYYHSLTKEERLNKSRKSYSRLDKQKAKIKSSEYYLKNKQKIREKEKQRRKENIDKYREKEKQRRKENSEAIRIKVKLWYEKNKDLVKERRKKRLDLIKKEGKIELLPHKKKVKNLQFGYIKGLLVKQKFYLERKEIPEDLIHLKRNLILIKRKVKNDL